MLFNAYLSCNFNLFPTNQEVQENQLDTNAAYILFYQRRNLDFSGFMPEITGKTPDTQEIEDEFESEFKKLCVIQ